MFDFRDRADDQAAGIRSMVTWFTEKGVNRLFFSALLIFAVCTAGLGFYSFSVMTIVLLLVPAIIAGFVYEYSKTNFSDYLYYLILDGLMMFSALLMLVFRI
jgi:1,4-dihydroxy-2-naphthoate octaprenyltransferase